VAGDETFAERGEQALNEKPHGGDHETGEDALVGGGDAEGDAACRFAGELRGEIGFAAHHGAKALAGGGEQPEGEAEQGDRRART